MCTPSWPSSAITAAPSRPRVTLPTEPARRRTRARRAARSRARSPRDRGAVMNRQGTGVERTEHEDAADVGGKPLPEPLSAAEDQDVRADHDDDDYGEHVQHLDRRVAHDSSSPALGHESIVAPRALKGKATPREPEARAAGSRDDTRTLARRREERSRACLPRLTTTRRVERQRLGGAAMFEALRARCSKDDAAKAERKARKAETVAKRGESKAHHMRVERERRDRMTKAGGGGGG
jgi:hypothetical protein